MFWVFIEMSRLFQGISLSLVRMVVPLVGVVWVVWLSVKLAPLHDLEAGSEKEVKMHDVAQGDGFYPLAK